MKKKIFILTLFLFTVIYPQQINFNSTQNIKSFADYLFCDKDYLRAIEEYEKYLNIVQDDSIQFKIALSYSKINDEENAFKKLSLIKNSSSFYVLARIESLKSLFFISIDSLFFSTANEIINSSSPFSNNSSRLSNTSMLLTKIDLPEREKFLIPFEEDEKSILNNFYDLKKNPPYKSPALAGVLSALIPGSGKIYTRNYSDGITAFLLTGVLAYLSYTNFEHKHYTRAWIFTALGAGFYTGNVYGSIAATQIFNAKINFEFDEGVKLFLEDKNYFIPAYDLCK